MRWFAPSPAWPTRSPRTMRCGRDRRHRDTLPPAPGVRGPLLAGLGWDCGPDIDGHGLRAVAAVAHENSGRPRPGPRADAGLARASHGCGPRSFDTGWLAGLARPHR